MRFVKPLQLALNLAKTPKKKRGRLLGLDVGDRYVGVAFSDPKNKIASPFCVLVRKKTNIDNLANDFSTLISEFSSNTFVVGMPFDKPRSSSEAYQVKAFMDELGKTGKFEGLQYTYWNECFTSKNVELLLKPLNLNPVQEKTILDKFAAVGILQGYLDYANRKKEEATEEHSK
ncbi:putative pre-16S rRNA nuclease isoform X1 [Senna tora]|uniref:Putative pre-16S rRNA nuclease isoform X1 n=1 Tax=Senna tora TaxID=362788 RepID=A0A834TVM4_9FABA|nr:putative pre-16S rRNA nuclease isoform X1 [Senna tora]